ncbi:MAG: EI24 domain-containing protein [Bacteroidia bacterium]|nr:EI24 domain-containing protein [Bacteroidia bacterium]
MIKDITDSISAYGSALGMISQHNLWRYIIIPGLVSMGVMFLLVAGPVVWFANSSVEQTVVNMIPWEGMKGVAEGAADVIIFLLTTLIIFFLGKYIVLAVVSPFMGALSEKVEKIVTGKEVPNDSNFLVDLIRGIRVSLRNLVRELFFTLMFLLLNFIPIIGSIAATVLTLGVEAFYAGFGNMDYTLERKRYSVSQSVIFVKQNRGVAIGNGLVFLGLLLIPVLGWFLAPAFATISATVMCLKKFSVENLVLNK